MSLGNDYLRLIKTLFSFEEFNMWNPKGHSTLAYLMNAVEGSADYQCIYESWLNLLSSNNFNEFAWQVVNLSVKIFTNDEKASPNDKKDFENWIEISRPLYEKGRLPGFGIIPAKYTPDWFWGLFKSYMTLEEVKRENAIIDYCKNECGMSDENAKATFDKLYEHYDLLNEFYFFVKNNRFYQFNPTTVELISARQVHDTLNLSPLESYNFLIYLRESPEHALAEFNAGQKRK